MTRGTLITDGHWKVNDPSQLSQEASLILWPRSSKKWNAEWFVEPMASLIIILLLFNYDNVIIIHPVLFWCSVCLVPAYYWV